MVEDGAWQIIGKISDKEYLMRRVSRGSMPRFNRVLEELGIHHEEHEVPLEVLATIEEKKRKAATKNVTAAAETKKRKGVGASQVAAKKQKTSVAAEASAASTTSSTSRSVKASANAKEDSAKNSGGGPMSTGRRSSSRRRMVAAARGLWLRIILSPPLPTHCPVFLVVTHLAQTRQEMPGTEVPILRTTRRLGAQAIATPWMLKSWRCQKTRWTHSLLPCSTALAFSHSRIVGRV
jgi:hypothetical protein